MMEEKERARRMLEGEGTEIEKEVERLFSHEVVLNLEEQERQRRIELENKMKTEAHEMKVTLLLSAAFLLSFSDLSFTLLTLGSR
jgi:hypothetical protein